MHRYFYNVNIEGVSEELADEIVCDLQALLEDRLAAVTGASGSVEFDFRESL